MILFTGESLDMLHPWRGSSAPIPEGPAKPPSKRKVWNDARAAWMKKVAQLLPKGESHRDPEAERHIEALNARCLLEGKAATSVELDPDAQGLAFVVVASKLRRFDVERPQTVKLVRDWVVNGGPGLAVRAMHAAWTWSYQGEFHYGRDVAVDGRIQRRKAPKSGDPALWNGDTATWTGVRELRTLLARLGDDAYAEAVAAVRALWDASSPAQKACLVYLTPTEQDLAEQLIEWGDAQDNGALHLLGWSLRQPKVLMRWCASLCSTFPNELGWALIASGPEEQVVEALGPAIHPHALQAASFVGHPAVAVQFAQTNDASTLHRLHWDDYARDFFFRFPELALEHLPEDSELRANVLRMNPDLDPNSLPVASDDEVPELLRTPHASKKELPPLWQAYTDLFLVGREKVLGPDHLERLGQALAKSKGRMTPALQEVRDALDPVSRGQFGWALYEAWRSDWRADKWLYRSLCVLHDDTVVDRLGAAIPKMAYQEGVTALEVLASTGSERALVRIAHVAAKGRGRGIKNAANNWLNTLARERGLTKGQLADRLVPTFGLDAKGSMTLDLGPRRFTVGFDEKLKPWVQGEDGKRRANLPSSKGDDPEKAAAAKKRWSQLKKDVRTIASTQIARFETSMVQGRAWTQDEFRTYLAGHPLVQHIVRRLIWVVDGPEGPVSFRVDEEGAFVDAGDEAVDLPAGMVRIAHPLDLDADTLSTWGEVLGDYEIIQCFPQVGRPTYPLASTAAKQVLADVEKVVVKGGTVVGLTKRGWERGGVEDAGQWYDLHFSGPGMQMMLTMDHGVNITGGYGYDEDQRLTLRVTTEGTPDPRAYSEGLLGLATLTSA